MTSGSGLACVINRVPAIPGIIGADGHFWGLVIFDRISLVSSYYGYRMSKVWQTTNQTTNHANIEPFRFSNQWLDWGDLVNLEFGNLCVVSELMRKIERIFAKKM